MRYRLNERLKQLEHKTFKGILPPIFIEILGDGMVEIYSDVDGKKERMTEEQYERHSERFMKSDQRAVFEISFVDDISSDSE
ncbi:hypothetical protein LMF32_05440 [Desemzia sp. C1]|uniref:hypothetical protein n=1 Tax=Desemzia sp. C1 TaxID=2892016 RepID=UPI001E653B84|nr:hypothetical protein [Desemzia sp. C1]MCI3028543.1 hypothetical protein [Desemzia sp. C1]